MANIALTKASIGGESSEPPVVTVPPPAPELPHAAEPAWMEEPSAASVEGTGTNTGVLDVRADAPDGAYTEPLALGEDIVVEAVDGHGADGAAEAVDEAREEAGAETSDGAGVEVTAETSDGAREAVAADAPEGAGAEGVAEAPDGD